MFPCESLSTLRCAGHSVALISIGPGLSYTCGSTIPPFAILSWKEILIPLHIISYSDLFPVIRKCLPVFFFWGGGHRSILMFNVFLFTLGSLFPIKYSLTLIKNIPLISPSEFVATLLNLVRNRLPLEENRILGTAQQTWGCWALTSIIALYSPPTQTKMRCWQ